MGKFRLEGVYSAITTPFRADETLDEKALRNEIEYQIKCGVNGVVVCSTPGEISVLSLEERKLICEIAVAQVDSRVALVVDTGSPRTNWATQLAEHAERTGASFVMVLSPWLLPQNENTLLKHYSQVIDALKGESKVILYNLPKYTNVNVSPQLFQKLIHLFPERIEGIKDTSGSMATIQDYIFAAGGKARVVCGDDTSLLSALAVGADGCIAALAACLPKLVLKMFEAFRKGCIKDAQQIQHTLTRVKKEFNKYPYLAAQKAAQTMLGRPSGHMRAPLIDLTRAERDGLRKNLIRLGILEGRDRRWA